ncbi:MAG: hypothetical protein HC841_06815 [Verrucomicrobiae bacterium]|nr:hypothetical protein [Verrucomicrobiae bacterium]
MTAIAAELDQKLRQFDPQTASSVEKLVRDVLQLAEAPGIQPRTDEPATHRAHIAKFAGIWRDDDFQRPPQGESEKREEW